MPPQTIRIPYDSNLRYLPLVYLLPDEMMARCPTLMKIPRNPYQVLQSNEWLDLIDSDQFLDEIMDAVSSLVFPFFGFRGWKEHYTGDFPVWKLSYSMPLWAKGVEQEIGWNLQRLFQLPRNAEIVFLPEKQIKELFEKIVKKVIAEQGWQPMLDALHEMPCNEDFEKQRTSVRTDFIRKWYHTRSKKVQSVSLERFRTANWDSDDDRLFYFPDPRLHLEEYVCARVDAERFLKSLPWKERRIIQMRDEGYSYMEIAAELGFANHSSVIKRMKSIKKKYQNYMEA